MKCPRCKHDLEPAQFWPIELSDAAEDLTGLSEQAQDDLLAWWNEARRSRHGPRCTWTRSAWRLSVRRIRSLFQVNPSLAQATIEGGIECGWMALKPEYVQQQQSTRTGATGSARPSRDGFMQTALTSWNRS